MLMKHNKKRNVGLVYEFLTRKIGESILSGNDSELSKTKTIIKKHFNKSTTLYKELKLFRAVHEAKLSSPTAAYSLLEKVKEVCQLQSQSRLDLEKTSLIKDINEVLGEGIFNTQISEYKRFASIQQLLNAYRQDQTQLFESINELTILEEKVVSEILANKIETNEIVENVIQMTETDVDKLVVNLMTEKVNKKFSELNEEQKSIITMFVFQNEQAKENLVSIFERLQQKFNIVFETNKNSADIKTGLIEVKEMMSRQYSDITNLTEELVTFYLGISKLVEELEKSNNVSA